MSLRTTQGFWPVFFAIGGNAFVTVIKLIAATVSGSSAMFSEAIHSVADTANQVLLLVGLRQSLKKADERFAYGYGNERFFWALISACGIFFVGAGVTAYNGIQALTEGHSIEFNPIIFGALVVSFAVELYTLKIAADELRKAFPKSGWRERVRQADSATLAVLLEDSVALFGVLVAAGAITLSYYTGNPVWDAAGSLLISLLLAGVAVTLVIRNRSYLLGKAMPEGMKEDVIALIEKDPAIEKVIDFKSSTLGLGSYRIKCEVEFNGPALLRDTYREAGMRDEFEEVKEDFEDFKKFLADYADRIPRLMGKRIDKIEARIRKYFPSIRNIDIEIN